MCDSYKEDCIRYVSLAEERNLEGTEENTSFIKRMMKNERMEES